VPKKGDGSGEGKRRRRRSSQARSQRRRRGITPVKEAQAPAGRDAAQHPLHLTRSSGAREAGPPAGRLSVREEVPPQPRAGELLRWAARL